MPEDPPEEERRKPEEFLAEAKRASRGKLKIYLGLAAGVGKTYRMMTEAKELHKQGVDVVVGAFEAHGREGTMHLADGFESIPMLEREHRGVKLQEFDLAAALTRHPQLILMDELAHTNAPGLKNEKRWQDVLELLEAGVNVNATLNVQHVESLNDIVSQATGVRVQETVPDSVLQEVASEMVNVDIPVDELLKRLREGRVYPAHRIRAAMGNFFQEENLHALRELALRETAKDVAAQAKRSLEKMRPHDRLLVCLPKGQEHARKLVRIAARLAGRNNTEWAVAYVETPGYNVETRTVSETQALQDTLEFARTLGAEAVRLEGKAVAATLLEYAKKNRVGQIVVGRTKGPLNRFLKGGTVRELLEESGPVDVHVVNLDEPEPGR
ncbi:MAG: universal stress protein [Thermoplasmatota archaeon]